MLCHGVLRNVERVALGEVVARRLDRNTGVVPLRDLCLYLPVEAVTGAGQDMQNLVGHVPTLAGPTTRRYGQLERIDAERTDVGVRRRRQHPHAAERRAL